jgi:hypothetical protein
MRVTL